MSQLDPANEREAMVVNHHLLTVIEEAEVLLARTRSDEAVAALRCLIDRVIYPMRDRLKRLHYAEYRIKETGEAARG